MIPFEFEEATPFSQYDGFARAKMDGQRYLLDTTCTTYLLATSLVELSSETEALDLHVDSHENLPYSLSDDIGKYEQLKVILAYTSDDERGNIQRIPASIGKLGELRHLNLRYNQLSSLPPEIGALSQLRHLDLSGNQLTSLPPEIRALSSL